ncbi:MAG: thiol peroxidase [Acidobacteriota bacterium]
MATERPNATTLKGTPFTLVGPELKAGDTAPDFTSVGLDLKPVTLADTGTTTRIFSVVPSLDTPVCDQMTRRFNDEAKKSGLKVYTISMDLPFAQKRWCGASGAENVVTLSDHKDASFGAAWGTLIKELRLDSRAVFVVDSNNKIRYVEYVKEVAEHPNYDAALAAARGQ